ncbi:hypothetical protein [Streptomyces sp. NPDC088725]|uniref:hypothetical protein n=1 Tax=Streptomyces sp. NPDC088725 TaxID=3365873 RepID=UPI0038069AFF
MIVSFSVRRQAAAKYNHYNRGGPVTGVAQALHAGLYGLPADDDPLPTALDALLQATHTANAPEQKAAILRQVADQLRNAAEIIQRYQERAQWDRFPDDIAEQLRDAYDQVQQVATNLDLVAPAFSSRSSTDAPTGSRPRPAQSRSATTPASPAPPAAHHR